MLALYSRLNKEQSKALQKALTTFYEILFSSKDNDKIDDTVPFAPNSGGNGDGSWDWGGPVISSPTDNGCPPEEHEVGWC